MLVCPNKQLRFPPLICIHLHRSTIKMKYVKWMHCDQVVVHRSELFTLISFGFVPVFRGATVELVLPVVSSKNGHRKSLRKDLIQFHV